MSALPYDRDSLFAAFENQAPTPRPHTAELDTLFQRFRGPFAEATRLAALADQVRAALRDADGTAAGALRDSLTFLVPQVERASARLDSVRAAIGPRIDSLRAEIRTWEATAFRDWPEAVSSLSSGQLTRGIVDTTRFDGTVRLYLSAGSRRWWIYARSFNSGDPHTEWYWNLPVTGSSVTLDTSNGRLRPRY